MKERFYGAATLAVWVQLAGAATDIDLSAATCVPSGSSGVKLASVAVTGLTDRYNATLVWDTNKNVLGVTAASKNLLSAVNVDFSASTCKLTGPTGLLLRNIGVTGVSAKYWAKFKWDSSTLQFTLADYGAESSNGPTKKYLLSFHACNSACNDPGNHYSYLAQSDDGTNWSILSGWSPLRGSVPDIVRRGNKLYLYSTGFLYRYSFDTNIWDKTATQTSLKNADGSKESFVDPSVMLDDNGKIVLFFLSSTGSTSDPATCVSGVTTCTKYFRSAVEVDGSDGVNFTVQPGNRLEISLNTANGADYASDPDVYKGADDYIMYISRGGNTQAFSAKTMHGTYTAISGLTNGYLLSNAGGVPAGYYHADNKEYWTYAHTSTNASLTYINRAVTSGLSTTLTSSQTSKVFDGTSIGLGSSYVVASPGFTVNDPY